MTRQAVNRDLLNRFMEELAADAPRRPGFSVYITGGGTAIDFGWREGTIDIDVSADRDDVFRSIQQLIKRLNVNIEFAKPTDFVPPVPGWEMRHRFIRTIRNVSYFHFDPYTQVFSKILRGYEKDISDASSFVAENLVSPREFLRRIKEIPESAFQKYPGLSLEEVLIPVKAFFEGDNLKPRKP